MNRAWARIAAALLALAWAGAQAVGALETAGARRGPAGDRVTDPRFAGIVAEVPFAADLDPASPAHPRVPLGLVRAGRDAWLPAP